ncbi:MAG: ATP-binding protein [Desulfobacteraceae bacterium]|nr:ATP-binding protein [Desulfobacteraceae bacterium]
MKKYYEINSGHLFSWCFGLLLLFGLVLSSMHSYLLFHSLAEVFSMLVSFSIFLFAWNTLGFTRERYLIVLGIAYLFAGCLDLSHMLAYKGMAVIAVDGANHATQAWIAARYVESLSLLAVPFLFKRRIDHRMVFAIYFTVSGALFLMIFAFKVFPDCYVGGTGLTPFKIISEYIICVILIAAGIALYFRRDAVDGIMFKLLLASIGFTVASEIAFTSYISVYGPANMIGHLFKIISSYLVYRAIVVHGLRAPYKSMFRELSASKSELERYSHSLESCVAERTRELEESNRELRYLSGQLVTAEQKERRRIARDLHDSISQSLSAIKLSVENISSNLSGRLDSKDKAALEKIVSMCKEAIQEVRRIIMNLRPPALDSGINATIDSLCREFNSFYPDIRIRKKLEVRDDRLPEEVKATIFRLLQEALNNIGRHSGAGSVNVFLSEANRGIRFEVIDDGKGFDPKTMPDSKEGGGFGLAGMQERAELSGGAFYIRSRRGAGTSIVVTWPDDKAGGRFASAG